MRNEICLEVGTIEYVVKTQHYENKSCLIIKRTKTYTLNVTQKREKTLINIHTTKKKKKKKIYLSKSWLPEEASAHLRWPPYRKYRINTVQK